MIAVATDTNTHIAVVDAEGNVTGIACGKLPKRHWIVDTTKTYTWKRGQGHVEAQEGEESYGIHVVCNRCTGAHRNRLGR